MRRLAAGAFAALLVPMLWPTAVRSSGPRIALSPVDSARVICVTIPGTFEQKIQAAFREATAVFVGEVRSGSVESVTVSVERVWKGRIAAQVVMPTGNTEDTIVGESFEPAVGEKYVLFAHGQPSAAPLELLRSSACEPNVKLRDAARTIAVLDSIGKSAGQTGR